MQRYSRRIQRLSRNVGAKRVDDVDGVIAVLQIAKRLVKDAGKTPYEALLIAADDMASPKDPVMAFWAAHYAYTMQQPRGLSDAGTLDEAIKAQGLVNQLVRKGPR